jgi:hypothetical protein
MINHRKENQWAGLFFSARYYHASEVSYLPCDKIDWNVRLSRCTRFTFHFVYSVLLMMELIYLDQNLNPGSIRKATGRKFTTCTDVVKAKVKAPSDKNLNTATSL